MKKVLIFLIAIILFFPVMVKATSQYEILKIADAKDEVYILMRIMYKDDLYNKEKVYRMVGDGYIYITDKTEFISKEDF